MARARRTASVKGQRRTGRARPIAGAGVSVSPRAALLIVFAVALAWRWLYLDRLRGTLLFGSLAADAGVYWAWSDHILREGLVPPGPFFLAPLYPYCQAGIRFVTGGTAGGVLICQALLGAAGVTLLAHAAMTLTRPAIGLAVGILLAGFSPAVFFDGLLLPESLLFAIECGLVWLVVRGAWSASSRSYLLYGLVVGVLAQGRATSAALIALLPLLSSGRDHRASMWRNAAIATGALGLLVAPSLVANYLTAREVIPFTYNLGLNLYIGNHPQATGTYVDVLEGAHNVVLPPATAITGGGLDGRGYLLHAQGVRTSPAQSSAHWAAQAVRHVRSAPMRTVTTTGRKALLMVNHRDIAQIESREAFEDAAGPIGIPVLGGFGLLAVLGLAGIPRAVMGGGFRERWLAGYVCVVIVATLPFFVTDRYRLHLVPGLAMLAAITLDACVRSWSEKSWRRSGSLAMALVVALSVVSLPLLGGTQRLREWGRVVDRGARLLNAGAYDQARIEFRRAEELLSGVRLEAMSASARIEVGEFYRSYARAQELTGDVAGAVASLDRATSLNPGNVEALSHLYSLLRHHGTPGQGAEVRTRLARVAGGEARLHLSDGWDAAARGDLDRARDRFERALVMDPGLGQAWEGRLRVEIQAGRYAAASQVLERARSRGLEATHADVYDAFLRLERGDRAGAERLMRGIDPRNLADPNLRDLGERVAQRLRSR